MAIIDSITGIACYASPDQGNNVKAAALCPAVDVVNCPYIDGIGVHM